MNLATNLIEAAERHADRPAVRLDDAVLSYADLLQRARRRGPTAGTGLRSG